MESQQVVPVRAAEVESPAEREVGKSSWPVNEAVGCGSTAKMRERQWRWRRRVCELERMAI